MGCAVDERLAGSPSRSDGQMPGRVFVKAAAGEAKNISGSLVPSTFPGPRLVTPHRCHLLATDGMKIPAQLFLPSGLKAGERRPAFLYSRRFAASDAPRLALHGLLPPDLRDESVPGQPGVRRPLDQLPLGIGYGMEFREASDYGAAGASEYADVRGPGCICDARRVDRPGGSLGRSPMAAT